MNMEIYNKDVASLQFSLKNLERNILNGQIKMETIADFYDMNNKLEKLKNEYNSVYYNISNPVSQKQFRENLEHETNFLNIMLCMFNSLNHYHEVLGFVENYEIEREWQDVKTILNYNNYIKKMRDTFKFGADIKTKNSGEYSDQFNFYNEKIHSLENSADEARNRIIELGNANEILPYTRQDTLEKTKEQVNEAQNRIALMSREAIKSLDRFFEKSESDEENIKDENIEGVKNNDYAVDINYLNTLNSASKITYLGKIIKNIELARGKKVTVKYNGSKKRVSSIYRAKYIKAVSLLNQTKKEFEEEKNVLLKDEKIDSGAINEYASIYTNYKEVESDLFALRDEALPYLNTNKVIAVASFGKEPFYVLQTSLNKFNRVFVNYKKAQSDLKKCATKNNIEIIDSGEKLENLDVYEQKIFDEIYKLQQEMNYTENIEKVASLRKELYKLNKGKKYALFANLKVLFKSFALTNDLKTFLLEVAEKPEEFAKNNEYAIDEKKEYLSDCLNKIKLFSEKFKKKNQTEENKKPNILEVQANKIKEVINKLPKNKKNVLKIKNIREPQNKKRFIYSVASVGVICAAGAGLLTLANSLNSREVASIKDDLASKSFNIIQENKLDLGVDKLNIGVIDKKDEVVIVKDVVKKSSTTNNIQEEKQKEEVKTPSNVKKEVKVATVKDSVEPKKEVVKLTEPSLEDIDLETLEEAPTYMDIFDDSFKANDTIYQTAEDAYLKENPLTPYFDEDSIHNVEGVVYEYNGTVIKVMKNEVDAESKIKALENNNAILVGYLGSNEDSLDNGYEGYFSSDDVYFINNDEGRSR